jgi:hypothetical protein
LSVIVIAPHGVGVRVVAQQRDPIELVTFESISEFERWRSGGTPRTIDREVDAALEGARVDPGKLARTLPVLNALRRRTRVPHLKELVLHASSPRSFYRAWADEMPEAPSLFLERVRAIHARMLARGLALDHVWRQAGYRSRREYERAMEAWQ